MGHIVGRKRNVRTIKALRGESLLIDLGKAFEGTMSAWMKKNPNDTAFRSFEIRENRFLFLSKEKTQDYFNEQTDALIQSIEGRWKFDVRLTPPGETEENDTVIYTGTILFKNQVTGSRGVEITDPNTGLPTTFISLRDTPSAYGQPGQAVVVNETGDGLVFGEASGGGGAILKDNTLLLHNLQTATNGTLTYGGKASGSRLRTAQIFLEIPSIAKGGVSGRLNIGTLEIFDENIRGSVSIVPGILEFTVSFFDVAQFNTLLRITPPVDVNLTDYIGITDLKSDLGITILERYFATSLEEEVNIDNFIRTIIDDRLLRIAQFGTVEIEAGTPKFGILFELGEAEAIGVANSVFANLLELVVTTKDAQDLVETDFTEHDNYLTFLNSTQVDSFKTYEAYNIRNPDEAGGEMDDFIMGPKK